MTLAKRLASASSGNRGRASHLWRVGRVRRLRQLGPPDVARTRLGEEAPRVDLVPVTRQDVPPRIRAAFDDDMAEGVAWKLAPLRVFPVLWEISLDNDCILWELPDAVRRWLEQADAQQCLLAEDARALYGQFTPCCSPEPRNAGIRGLPPQFPLQEAFERLIRDLAAPLDSELDEQGLQVAAVSMLCEPAVVSIDERHDLLAVSAASPRVGSVRSTFLRLERTPLRVAPGRQVRRGLDRRALAAHPPQRPSTRGECRRASQVRLGKRIKLILQRMTPSWPWRNACSGSRQCHRGCLLAVGNDARR